MICTYFTNKLNILQSVTENIYSNRRFVIVFTQPANGTDRGPNSVHILLRVSFKKEFNITIPSTSRSSKSSASLPFRSSDLNIQLHAIHGSSTRDTWPDHLILTSNVVVLEYVLDRSCVKISAPRPGMPTKHIRAPRCFEPIAGLFAHQDSSSYFHSPPY